MMNTQIIKEALLTSLKSDGEASIHKVAAGVHLCLVQSRAAGMASVIHDPNDGHQMITGAGHLQTLSLRELLKLIYSDNLLEASLGVATLNSALPLPNGYDKGNAFDLIRTQAKGKNLGVVGHFHFVDRFRPEVENLWVFEKKPQGDDLDESIMDTYLPACQVLVITAQTLTNNTLGHILELAPKAFKILLGPSAPLSTVLFDYGIDVIGGVKIINSDLVYQYIIQGAGFRQLQGIELVMIHK